MADYSGARTFDAIVAWVEQHEGKEGSGGGGQAAPAAPAKATSRGGRPSAGGRAAKAGPNLRAWLLALLTEHDPVSVGLTMLGVAGLFWCAASHPPVARRVKRLQPASDSRRAHGPLGTMRFRRSRSPPCPFARSQCIVADLHLRDLTHAASLVCLKARDV